MTLDEVLREVVEAIQPIIDRDQPNPNGVEETIAQVKKLFAEEPHIEMAFVAAVSRIAVNARKGWIKQ